MSSDNPWALTQASDAQPTDWDDAVKHYGQTGELRARDVEQVLGNPQGGVVIEAVPHMEFAYRNQLGG